MKVQDERELLRGKAGRKVLLHVKSADGKARDVLATPVTERQESGKLRIANGNIRGD